MLLLKKNKKHVVLSLLLLLLLLFVNVIGVIGVFVVMISCRRLSLCPFSFVYFCWIHNHLCFNFVLASSFIGKQLHALVNEPMFEPSSVSSRDDVSLLASHMASSAAFSGSSPLPSSSSAALMPSNASVVHRKQPSDQSLAFGGVGGGNSSLASASHTNSMIIDDEHHRQLTAATAAAAAAAAVASSNTSSAISIGKRLIANLIPSTAFQPLKIPFPDDEHYLVDVDSRYYVSDKNLSSIVAFTLSSKDYREFLSNAKAYNANANGNNNMNSNGVTVGAGQDQVAKLTSTSPQSMINSALQEIGEHTRSI